MSARDILEKISKTFTDRFWTELNMVRDATESITRNLRLEKNISSFQLKSTTLWNKFVRYVLSFFPTFDDIDDFSRLASFSPDDLSNISNESLLRWYQYFQDKKFVQERENIRKIFQARIQTTKELTPYLETFAR